MKIRAKDSLLEAKSLCFSWDAGKEPVLTNVSMTLETGEILGIVGPNGAGKSTLLRLLAGLLKPTGGRVRLLGEDLRAVSHRSLARSIAFVPQDMSVPFSYTVEELVLMGRFPHLGTFSLEEEGDVRIAHAALDELGLRPLAGRPIDQVSGGEKQRAFIARALTQKPRLLLCDEPTSHLDLRHQNRLVCILKKLVATSELSAVVVLHDLNLAACLCDRLLLLHEGLAVADDRPERVLSLEILEPVYQASLAVGVLPDTGRPYVLPSPENEALPSDDVSQVKAGSIRQPE